MKLAAVEAIASALADAEVRYLVVGGLAVAAHGYGRLTYDLDLVVELRADNVRRALEALAHLGYRPALPVDASQLADPATRRAWIEQKNMVVLQLVSSIHPDTPIDLFVEEPFDFEAEHRRAYRAPLGPAVEIPCADVETLIAMKRAAGRPKDLEDARQLELLRDGIRDDE